MESESKLLPVLRDAVTIVKMVLKAKYPEQSSDYIRRLAGAVVNEVFLTPNTSPQFAQFDADNQTRIKTEIDNLAASFVSLRIPITDALRVQFLCDSLEGIDSSLMLAQAEAAGILLMDRQVPLPKTFMAMVRRIGAAHDILQSATYPATEEDEGD